MSASVNHHAPRVGTWKWPVAPAEACDDTALLSRFLDGLRRYNPPEQSPKSPPAKPAEPVEPQSRGAVRVRPYIDYTPGSGRHRGTPDPAEPRDPVAVFLAAARSGATS